MHISGGFLHFGGRYYLVYLLLGGHTAEKAQDGAHFAYIDALIAVMVEYAEGIGDALLQIVVNGNCEVKFGYLGSSKFVYFYRYNGTY